ncbi:MAG: DNA-directed RNA polymerase subunit omega [Ruminococcaceae bacterium]|nr:DNA-directed RNA polymerase subunit omega [Oscillospiraceae bacterium]
MMNEPSIEKLTQDGLNRYQVCIATAKIAREIIDQYNEEAERISSQMDTSGAKRPIHDDKPVKTAVHAIDNGEFEIIVPEQKTDLTEGNN